MGYPEQDEAEISSGGGYPEQDEAEKSSGGGYPEQDEAEKSSGGGYPEQDEAEKSSGGGHPEQDEAENNVKIQVFNHKPQILIKKQLILILCHYKEDFQKQMLHVSSL